MLKIRLPLANEDLAYLESGEYPETAITLTALVARKPVPWQAENVPTKNFIDQQTPKGNLGHKKPDPFFRNPKPKAHFR